MGKRKYRVILLLFVVFLFFGCIQTKNMTISNCSIQKESIGINIDCSNFNQRINEVSLTNDECYYVFDMEDIDCKQSNNRLLIKLDCSNKKIKTNQEYRLTLRFPGGYAYANIFFGNPIKKIGENYPCEDFKHIRILIFDQSAIIGI